MSDIYGKIFYPYTLVQGTIDLLQSFFPQYLQHASEELKLDSDYFDIPTNYTQRNAFTQQPGESLPKIVVVTPGTINTPQKSGDGIYRATWRLGVGIAVAAQTEDEAYFKATVYGAVVRAIVIHHPSINGVSSNTILIGEAYDDLAVIAGQIEHYRSSSNWFAVDIDNIVQRASGPQLPANVYGIAEEVKIEYDRSN